VRIKAVCVAALLMLARFAWGDTVSGVVTDNNRMPVKDATVWLWQERGIRFATTGDAGIFRFENAVAGPSHVVARREGLAMGGADVYVLGDTDVSLQLGDQATLTLRVVDREFNPVEGAYIKSVYVSDTFGVPIWELAEHGFPSTRSDADGVIAISCLPLKGHVSLIIYHAEYAETRLPYLPITEKRQPVQLSPGVPVRGRVVSPDRKAVANARVVVYKQSGSGRRDFAERFTDPEGFYNLRVEPGEYFVDVRHPKFAGPLLPVLTVPESEPVTADVQLVAPARLRGKVVGPEGKPAAGVPLRYYIEDRFYDERLSRNDGTFDLTIPAGDGLLRVVPPEGYVTASAADIPVHLEHARDVQMTPIELKALPVIEGRVLGPDGTPQPGVLLSTRNIEPPFWGITDADGHFSVRITKPPEGLKAAFRAEHGLRFLRKDFEVDLRDAAKPREVVLEPFEPDLSRPEPAPGENDLVGLLDVKAPEPIVDMWFNSEPLTVDSFKRKVVVLTLWAGFDTIGPTRDRMYELCALHTLFKEEGDVVFLGIHDNGSEGDEIKQFIEKYGIAFPVARDVEQFTTFSRYNTAKIPQTVLIDRAGRIRFVEVNGRLLELIKSLRREK
jgi:peroxiredoxin